GGGRFGWLAASLRACAGSLAVGSVALAAAAEKRAPVAAFRTSDRCIACHNGLLSPAGDDVSIGFDWRASTMANSSRDPYWQASGRPGGIQPPESEAAVQDGSPG